MRPTNAPTNDIATHTRAPDRHDAHRDKMATHDAVTTASAATHRMPPGPHAGAHGGHAGHRDTTHGGGHDDHAATFRDRFWWSLLLALPVVASSHQLQESFGYSLPEFAGSALVAPVLGTIVFGYGGWPFLVGGVAEARDRRPGMMLLIAMAITVAFLSSAAATLGLFDVGVWWELSLLIVIMLLGHWLEMRAVGQAQDALAALADLLSDEAERQDDDGTVRTVPLAALAVGDVVLVRTGGRAPVDGTVVAGAAALDESMLTGESTPVARGVGDRVGAASIATDGALRIRIDAVGDDTALAGIRRLVAQAQQSRSRTQVLADRAAALLFHVAVVSAVVTIVAWGLLGQPDAAVTRAMTVLIIACPHALGLAIPLVTSISTAKSARNGILITDRLALERMRTVDAVLFDKTGTLTRGRHVLSSAAAVDGVTDRVLALAAAAEADSEHPLARAIVAATTDRGITVPAASGFTSMTGRGVRATVDDTTVAVGGPALLSQQGLAPPAALAAQITRWQARGAAVLYVIADGAIAGALALEDEVRPESRDAVTALRTTGVTVAMLTGDAQQVADAAAADLGIDEVLAEVLPEDKDAAVTALQDRGHTVAMVGDGVNDAPALARADVGIAIGAGTDVAIGAAGIVLASDDPRGVLAVRRLPRASYRKMIQNLWWAAGYNLAAIPLAAGALAFTGVVLPMAAGAVLMTLSTVIVALNAQLLRRVDLHPA
ncbi:MAG TPA: heavy metal translocating P-type ATPase [Euzebyales bacterium]